MLTSTEDSEVKMNVEEIKELIHVFAESGLEEIEAEAGGDRLYLKRSSEVQVQAVLGGSPEFGWNTVYTGTQIETGVQTGTAVGLGGADGFGGGKISGAANVSGIVNGSGESAGKVAADDGDGGNTEMVKAPIVGIFYEASAPGEEPFVREGQKVKKGDVLCVIEAMKMMNELKADVDGTVKKVDVKNGEAVEFGQVLFEVERC